jgi:hypothetical protein
LDVDGTSYNTCGFARDAGIMPVVRLYQEDPYPGGRLSEKHRAVLPQLVAQGCYYFERGNEPNLVDEWKAGTWPTAWTSAVYDALVADWLADAQYIVDCGGYPAIDACSPGGDLDDITYLSAWLTRLKAAGVPSWMGTRAWASVHNAGLNHPLDYPDDAVNQAEHPGQTIHKHFYANGKPTGASNCIRKPEAVHQLVLDILGLDLPIICTEGGFWPGNAADSRYPALTEQTASDLQATTLRQMQTAPAWWFASCPWLLGNRELANEAKHFEWESWIRKVGWGNCPQGVSSERAVMAALEAAPCQERSVAVTQTEIETALGAAIQTHVIPLVPGNDFAIKAKARGYTVIRSDEEYIKLADGNVYCTQAWQDPDDDTMQHIIAAKVEGANWWQRSWWFSRSN